MISIILNVYNGEKYIKRCVESVLAQTYQNFELLIIDDGSTDSTAKIIDSYPPTVNVKVFHTEFYSEILGIGTWYKLVCLA